MLFLLGKRQQHSWQINIENNLMHFRYATRYNDTAGLEMGRRTTTMEAEYFCVVPKNENTFQKLKVQLNGLSGIVLPDSCVQIHYRNAHLLGIAYKYSNTPWIC